MDMILSIDNSIDEVTINKKLWILCNWKLFRSAVIYSIFALSCLQSIPADAVSYQTNDSTIHKNQPGRIFGNLYVNFMADIDKNNSQSSFDAEQVQLGYEHKVSSYWTGNMSIEIFVPGNGPSIAISNFFLKTAFFELP